jgi:molybdenum cofactor synthesis domain-containing protein
VAVSSVPTSGEPDPVQSALDRFLAAFPAGPRRVEDVPLDESLERVTAADIAAAVDSPPYARAIVEGYLVAPADVASASASNPVTLSIAGTIRPGDVPPERVAPNTAWEVSTGSAIPAGAWSVLRQWDVTAADRRVTVVAASPPDANIEAQGCDLRQGTVVISKGVRLGPDEIALLGAQGLDTIPVSARPIVGIFGSGNEVIPHTARLTPGAIWDCNTPALRASVRREGGVPRTFGVIRDDFDTFHRALAGALPHCAMIIIAGGTAVGGREFIRDLVGALGSPGVIVNGVPMRSGKPLIMGVIGEVPIVCVAGHPPEALRGFRLFGAPAIARLLGRTA